MEVRDELLGDKNAHEILYNEYKEIINIRD